MNRTATLEQARAAKQKVAELVRDHPHVNGVGIAREGSGYAVKLNLSSRTGSAGLPKKIDGVPVRIETVGPIAKRKRLNSGTEGRSKRSAR